MTSRGRMPPIIRGRVRTSKVLIRHFGSGSVSNEECNSFLSVAILFGREGDKPNHPPLSGCKGANKPPSSQLPQVRGSRGARDQGRGFHVQGFLLPGPKWRFPEIGAIHSYSPPHGIPSFSFGGGRAGPARGKRVTDFASPVWSLAPRPSRQPAIDGTPFPTTTINRRRRGVIG